MSEKIDRLCEQLRIRLQGIDRRLEALKGNNATTSEKSRHLVESQMDTLQQRIFDRRHAVETANASVAEWIEKRSDFSERITSWRSHGNLSQLRMRADDAEDYAVAAFELAVAAADEAAQAALEALLARSDEDVAALQQNEGEGSGSSTALGR